MGYHQSAAIAEHMLEDRRCGSIMCHVLAIKGEPFAAMVIEDVLIIAGASSSDIAMTQVEAARRRLPDLIAPGARLLESTGPSAVAAIRDYQGVVPVALFTATLNEC